MNFKHITDGIARVLETEEALLMGLSEEATALKRNSQNRSVKQLLGHLIDSASNNHQRMVRLQYSEHLTFPDYQQDNDLWIALQDYQHADWKNMVQLWKFYNLHIIQVINAVNNDKLNNDWLNFEGNKITLKDMIEGYLSHLQMHIEEIHELL